MTGMLKEQRQHFLVRPHGQVQQAEDKALHRDALRTCMGRIKSVILHVQRHARILLFKLQYITKLET